MKTVFLILHRNKQFVASSQGIHISQSYISWVFVCLFFRKVYVDSETNVPYNILMSKVDVKYGMFGLNNFYKMQVRQPFWYLLVGMAVYSQVLDRAFWHERKLISIPTETNCKMLGINMKRLIFMIRSLLTLRKSIQSLYWFSQVGFSKSIYKVKCRIYLFTI